VPEVVAGRAVVDALEAEGVRAVFGIPGGHVIEIYDALFDSKQIRHVLARHEQAAASMAAGYAQMTGEPGVCLVTAGPGATNLLSGVAEAFVGALPMIVIAGRGPTSTVHRGASQEVPTEKIFAPVAKRSVRVDRADLLPSVIRQAFVTARGGKPGPVVIDVPRDLLGQSIVQESYRPAGARPRPCGEPASIERAAEALASARRPVIVAGGGAVASGAFDELRSLAETLNAPVLTSLAGRGSLPDDHPLAAGGLGVHRTRISKRVLTNADVVLGLGTRFEEMETNWRPDAVPPAAACYIQVDTDPDELGRSVPVDIPIVGDVAAVADQLSHALADRAVQHTGDRAAAAAEVAVGLREIETDIEALLTQREEAGAIHPVRVLRAVRAVFPRDASVSIDVGCIAQAIAGSFPYFSVYEPRSLIVPSSFYGMGFASAALPVARLVREGHPAVGFVGDGSFQMIMNVLPVAVEHDLPVTWCVLNDGALGSIRDIQQYRFDERYLATGFEYQPDLAALARACNCLGERVEDPDEVIGAVERALQANRDGRPAVIDFAVSRTRLFGIREHYSFYPESGAL
jgi:acetolactate synthase-1/2/3 large subunit